MANGWTPERRARQAELIRTWCPWKNRRDRERQRVSTRISERLQGRRAHAAPRVGAASAASTAPVDVGGWSEYLTVNENRNRGSQFPSKRQVFETGWDGVWN